MGVKDCFDIEKADPLMAPETSAGEDPAMRRRRLRYRAWHRGTREMDLVLGPFADAHLDAMPEEELQRLEGLMSHEDTDLLRWVMGQEPAPAEVDRAILDRVIAFRATNSPAR